MKNTIRTLAAMLLLSAALTATASEVADYSKTINLYKANPTAAPYFESAYGYAVFPNVGKGGIGVGAAHGKGQTYTGGDVSGFTTMNQVSFGLQLGGQAYSQVIFFEDQRAYEDFTSGNFEFDATASAIAITASVQASAGTAGGATASAGSGGTAGEQTGSTYRKGMQIFVIGKGGLMYEAAVAGQKFKFEAVD